MKRTFLNVLAVLMGFIALNAQEGFVIKAGYEDYLNMPQDMLIAPDGTEIFFLFSSIPENDSPYTNQIYKLALDGSVLNTYVYADSVRPNLELSQFLLVEDTLYVFGWGVREYKYSGNYLVMKKMDLELNCISTIENRVEQIDPFGPGYGKVKYHDGKFFMVNSYGNGGTKAAFHTEISKQGEILKNITDTIMGCTHIPYDFSILPENDGFKLYSFQTFDPQVQVVYGTIDFYNENFEMTDYYVLPYNFTNFYTYQATNDSQGFLSGQWIDLPSGQIGWRAGILKIENDTIIVESFLYSTTPDSTACPAYRHSLEILPDGNLIFCFNNMDFQMLPSIEPGIINLMKLTPDFEVIWHRYIYEPDTKYDAFEMHATPDDEIVILGAFSLAPYTNFWDMQALFIKTNSEGMITGIHDEFPGISSTETMLYPNPALDFVIVEFSMAYQAATFVINNISGQEVFRANLTGNKQQVDISSVPAGNYVYRIFNKKGLDESGKLVVGR